MHVYGHEYSSRAFEHTNSTSPVKGLCISGTLHWGMAGCVVLFDSQRKTPNKTHHFTVEFTVIFRNSFFEELTIR